MPRETRTSFLTEDEREVLREVCDEVGVPCEIVEEMIVAENLVYGMGRRHGIWEDLEALVNKGMEAQRRDKHDTSED